MSHRRLRARWPYAVIAALLALPTLFMLPFALVGGVHMLDVLRSSSWIERACTIERPGGDPFPGEPGRAWTMMYGYDVDGRHYTSEREHFGEEAFPPITKGSVVPCWTDPNDVSQAVLRRDTDIVARAPFFAGLILIVMEAALVYAFLAPRKPAELPT